MSITLLNTQKNEKDARVRMRFEITGPHKLSLANEAMQALLQNTEIDVEAESVYEGLMEKLGKDAVDKHIAGFIALRAGLPEARRQNLPLLFIPHAAQTAMPHALEEVDEQFDVDFLVRPKVELSSYEPVYVKVPPAQVTEQEMNAQLMREMNRFATYEETDGPVVEGDVVQVNMSTLANNRPEPTLSGDGMAIVLSRDLMPEGFVNAVVGMNVGEHKEFDFANVEEGATPVYYKVALDVVDKRRRIVPELTDEFVRTRLSAHDKTVEEFKERVRKFLQEQRAGEDKSRREDLATQELGTRLCSAVPDSLIEHTCNEMVEEMRLNAAAQGMSLLQFAQMQGMDEQQFQMNTMMQARQAVRQGLALDALYEHEGLTVGDDDYEAALRELAPGFEEEARKSFQRDDAWFIVSDMAKRLKAQEYVMKNAVFTAEG